MGVSMSHMSILREKNVPCHFNPHVPCCMSILKKQLCRHFKFKHQGLKYLTVTWTPLSENPASAPARPISIVKY